MTTVVRMMSSRFTIAMAILVVLALASMAERAAAGVVTATATPTATDTATPTATDTATPTASDTATPTATDTATATASETATATATDTATPTVTDTAATETATATATATPTDTATATATATAGGCAGLDVDGNGVTQASTDGVYIFRRLLGLITIVPTSFRTLDPSIPDDATIGANVDALGLALDVDGNGSVQASTDGVYVFRDLLGLITIVPASFRTLDPSIPDDATIAANIAAICGS